MGGPRRAKPRPPHANGTTGTHVLAGAGWMLVSCALLAGVAALGRYAATSDVHPLQVVFLRLLFAVLVMLPVLGMRGLAFLRTGQIRLYFLRAGVGMAAMTSWFTALAYLPIGKLTAISFLTPLFATAAAVLVFRERVGLQRVAATALGFAGALVILRPGIVQLGPGVVFALAAAMAMALSMMLIKSLTVRDDPTKIVFLSAALMTPMAAGPAIAVWTWPPFEVWPYLLALGPVATLGHITLTRAFAAADASFIAGFDFARLPFAVLYGWLAFGEVIDIWTWIGAAVIFAAGIYASRAEVSAQLRVSEHAGHSGKKT